MKVGTKSLADVNPSLASEACGWDPTTVSYGSDQEMTWCCDRNHTWTASVGSRTRGRGCPYCANQKVWPGFNDLASRNPELATQAHGWDPKAITQFSGLRMSWRCGIGHVWIAKVNNRARGRGCPYCANKKVLTGFNDLASKNPNLAAQAFDFDPTTTLEFSNLKVGWRCELGHVWDATVNSRSQGSDCPYHAGQMVWPGFNDLASRNPDLAAQAYGWNPETASEFSKKQLQWKCGKGHVWKASINNRSQGKNCPYCANQKIWLGYNDLETINPELARQASGFDPKTVTARSSRVVGWKCQFEHFWKASIYNRSNGSGCPFCTTNGFSTGRKGRIYFLQHPELDLFQIGISNNAKRRLRDHTRSGWQVIEVSESIPGNEARSYEQDGLRLLRRLGALFANDAGVKKFDGYTEAWTRDSLRIESLAELIAMVDEDRKKRAA